MLGFKFNLIQDSIHILFGNDNKYNNCASVFKQISNINIDLKSVKNYHTLKQNYNDLNVRVIFLKSCPIKKSE